MKGVAIGAANVVPGISGGTIALISGVYFPALDALGLIFTPGARKRKPSALLLPLTLGVMCGILLCSVLMDFLLDTYASWISVLITGLVIGSIPTIWQQARQYPLRIPGIVLMISGFLLSALLPFLASSQWVVATRFPSVLLFFSAIPAIMAMIIPGISGSLVLVILGVYPLFLSSIADLHWPSLLAFFLGAVLGLGVFSRAVQSLHQHHPAYLLWTVCGLLIGSPIATLKIAVPSEHLIMHLAVLVVSAAGSTLLFSSRKPS